MYIPVYIAKGQTWKMLMSANEDQGIPQCKKFFISSLILEDHITKHNYKHKT